MFTSVIQFHEKSDLLLSKTNLNHNLIMKLLEEGAIKTLIIDKVNKKNDRYIADLIERELQELV
jgi:hypothetical protein